MNYLLVVLFYLTLICYSWTLISPTHFSRRTRLSHPITRKRATSIFLPSMLMLLVFISLATPSTPHQSVTVKNASNHISNFKPISKPAAKPAITTKKITQTVPIPFSSKTQNDASLAKGQTKLIQVGQNGTQTLTYLVTFTNGKQAKKTLISSVISQQPQSQVTAIGTYVAPPPIQQVTQSTAPAPTPAPLPTPPPTTTCYPLTNGGNCYEPGEYCRESDHGTSGMAGDGEAITCSYNNGWRWEPS